MLIQEILTEDKYHATLVDGDPVKIAKKIKANCSIMLSAYQKTGKFLYRGIREARNGEDVVQGKIRQDRRPIFMPDYAHTIISDVMAKRGWPTRSNSLFCTTKTHIAKEWGAPYILFVKDGWQGLVFENRRGDYAFSKLLVAVKSGIAHAEQEASEQKKEATDTDREAGAAKEVEKVLDEMGPILFNSTEGLENVLAARYLDILITGQSYYGVKLSDEGVANAVLQELELA